MLTHLPCPLQSPLPGQVLYSHAAPLNPSRHSQVPISRSHTPMLPHSDFLWALSVDILLLRQDNTKNVVSDVHFFHKALFFVRSFVRQLNLKLTYLLNWRLAYRQMLAPAGKLSCCSHMRADSPEPPPRSGCPTPHCTRTHFSWPSTCHYCCRNCKSCSRGPMPCLRC